MKIKAVLFDLDGVLVDTRELHYEALNVALVENGFSRIEDRQHRELYNGLPTVRKLEMLVDRGLVTPDGVERVIFSKKKYTAQLLRKNVKFDPDVFCLISGLRNYDIPVAVVSNAVRETVHFVCSQLCISAMLRTYVCNEDGPPKPSPHLYRLACERLHVAANESLAVEDGAYGIEAAKVAGCTVLRVSGPAEVTPTNVWRYLC